MMKKALKILLLEDNASDVKLLQRALSKSFDDFKMKVIETREEYLHELEKPYDIIISDYALPDFDGMEALQIRNQQRPFMPFIITTGSTNEATAVQCMKEGADDYIIKEHITRIGEAVKRAMALKKTEYEKQQAFSTVQHLNRILKAIRNINQLITREHDNQKLVQQACEMFTEEQSYKAAFVSLFDEKGNLGKINAWSGFPEDDFENMVKALKKGVRPPCFQLAESSRDMIYVRHSEEVRLRCPLGKLMISSSAFCRMLGYQGKKLGFITVVVPDEVMVNEEEKELFREVTGDLAYALFNMQVENENRQAALRQKVLLEVARAAVLEVELEAFLSKVFEIVKEVADFDDAYVALYDPQQHRYFFPYQKDKNDVYYRESLPDSKKGLIELVRHRKKLVSLTRQRIKTLAKKGEIEIIGPLSAQWMGLPLVHKDTFIGVMALVHYTDTHAFSKNDEALLGFLSSQLALFIERKEAVTQLKISNERYKSVMQQASDAIILSDREGNIIEANEKAARSLGYSQEELLQLQAFDLVSSDLAKRQKVAYWDRFTPGNVVELETVFKKKDGSEFPVEISAGIVKIGGKEFVLSIARDISERKKAEEKIRQLSLGVEQSPASIVITDLDGNIQYVNRKFTEVSGYTAKEALGKNPRVLKSGKMPDSLYKELWKTISSGKQWHGEMINRRKDLSLYWELVSISPVTDEKGRITHYIAVKEDITARKEMESELRRAKQKAEESNRLKSEFLANMSHEIRTPMNGIMGFSALLEEEGLTEKARKDYVQVIRNSAKQLLHIIDEILEISQLQTHQVALEKQKLNLNEVLFQCFSELDAEARSKNLSLYVKKGLSDEEAEINGDREKLHKIMYNLLENALKFTQQGFVEIGYRLKGENLELYVKDTGIGISPEAREIIFEEFSQEDKRLSRVAGGLGLGLSIVKGNVDVLGGSIRLESEKGKGSTFFVEIPYAPVTPAGKKLLDATAAPSVEHLTLLVAEDNEVNYQYLEILLKKYCHNVVIHHAVTGKEAVTLFDRFPEIKLVLMDLKLPGMSGLEATRLIKEKNPEMVVIAQTAYTLLENQEESKKAGCDAFLPKPTHKEALFKVLDKYLKKEKPEGC